jgi:importin-5
MYFSCHQFSISCCSKVKLASGYLSQVSGPHLDEKQVRSIVDEIKQVITASSSRKHERAERAKEEDFDAEERELLKEENELEEELFDQV